MLIQNSEFFGFLAKINGDLPKLQEVFPFYFIKEEIIVQKKNESLLNYYHYLMSIIVDDRV